MNIELKMNDYLNDKLKENTILTVNEKKVLASLIYSYSICRKAKDNIIIRRMSDIRNDIKISNNDMYDAIRNLENRYHMIERTPGTTLGDASKFKLDFDKILNPPTEPVAIDFLKFLKTSKPSGTSINTVDIDTDIDIEKDTDIKIEKEINKDKKIDIKKDIKPEPEKEKNSVTKNGFATLQELYYKRLEKDKELTEISVRSAEMGSGVY